VELALELFDTDRAGGRALRIADLGTGSGVLLLSLLSELPSARGVGTDINAGALACARANAAALGFADRSSFVAGNHGASLAGGFDLVVANPPYVARSRIAALPPEVRSFDPVRALDGGADGLSAYYAIAADARRLLATDGVLVLELGAGQATAVTALLASYRLQPVGTPRPDLSGIPRALAVTIAPSPAKEP
jgi:release factor glutamine methyltransferase